MAEKKVKIVAIVDAETTGFVGEIDGVLRRTKSSGSVMQGIFQGIGQQLTRTFVDVARFAFRSFVNSLKSVGREIVEAVRFSAEFGEALSEVATLGVEDLDELRQGVLDLSSDLGLDLLNNVRGLYQAISAGVPEENVLDFLRVSSELAVAGLSDLETTVDGLTSVINAYGMSFDRAREISDVMFTTVRLGKTRIDELARFIGRVTPLAAQMGIEFEEVSAILASATRAGIRTRLAVTGLRAAIANVLTPSEQAQRVFENMGLTVNQVGEMIREGGLIQFLQQLTPDQLKEVISSVDGLNTVLAVIGQDGGAQFQSFLAEIQDSAGATEIALGKVIGTTARQWDILRSTLIAARTEIVQPIADYAGEILKILNEHLIKPLRDEVTPLIVAALEGFFLGDHAQAVLETVGLWSRLVIERLIVDLESALLGEIGFGEMIKGWIDDGWTVIQPVVHELGVLMARVFIEAFKQILKIAWDEYKNWLNELFMEMARRQERAWQLRRGELTPGMFIAPEFHNGGVVPDILGGGSAFPAMVQPGEQIIPRDEARAGARTFNVSINVSGAGDPRAVAREIKRVLTDMEREGRGIGVLAPELI